jgi:hypothetical protein
MSPKMTSSAFRFASLKTINSKTTVARGFELGNRNVSRTALRQEVVTPKIGLPLGISS